MVDTAACNTSLGRFVDLARTQVDLIFEQFGFDAEATLQEIIGERSNGLWELVKSGPLESANAAINEAFGFDIKGLANGQASFADTFDSFLDPQNLKAALSAPIEFTGDQLTELAAQAEGGAPPSVQAINKTITPSLRKSPRGADGSCESNVLYATAGTVASVAAGAVTEGLKKVSAAHSLFVGLANQSGGFIDGMFFVALSELDTAYSLEAQVLRNISDQIDRVNEAVDNLEDTVFNINHDLFLEEVARVLRGADLRFAGLQQGILNGVRFNEPVYQDGKARLQRAEDLLCNDAPDLQLTFSTTPYVLLAQIEVLQALRDAWQKAQGDRESYGRFLSEWRLKLNESLRTDNFLAPVMDLIRCRIKLILDDIQATIGKGDFFVYFAKEKKWCLELKVLIELVRSSEDVFGFGNDLVDLNDDLRAFTDSFILRPSLVVPAQTLVVQVDRYLSLARRRLTDPRLFKPVVTTLGDTLKVLINQRIDALEQQRGPLVEALGLADSEALKNIAAAKQYIEFLTGQGLQDLATAAIHGDWETFYSANPLSTFIKDKLGADLEQLKDCFLRTDNNEAVADQLDQFQEQTTQQARSAALVSQYSADSKEQYLDQVIGSELPEATLNIDSIQSQGQDLFGSVTTNPALASELEASGLSGNLDAYQDMIPVESAGSYGVVEESVALDIEPPPVVTTGDLYKAGPTPLWWEPGLFFPLKPNAAIEFLDVIFDALRQSYRAYYTNLLISSALAAKGSELTEADVKQIDQLVTAGIQF